MVKTVKIKKMLSLCLAVLFMSYYASISFFTHLHTINGATISHSHFHANSHHNTNNGGHTEHSITFIAQCSYFEYIDFSCDCFIKPSQFPLYGNKFVETAHWTVSIHLKNLSLRAPPIV